MATATDVIVRFLADSSSIQDEVGKVEKTGSKVKTWAKGIGAAIGTAFAVDQIRDWVGAASELQDQIAAAQQIFGGAAGAVLKFGDKSADAFGIAKSDSIAAANTFATFGKSAGLSGDKLAGFATGLTGLAGDLASFRGTSPEEAITAIGAALRGETEPIRQYGVLLDDATLKNRAMAMGLISSTKDALTPQQKVLAAQAEILAQTGDAQGDFARTSGSAANQQKTLQANLKDTQAALGTALLPVISAILPVLQTFARFIQENAGWLVPLTAAVLGITAAVWLFNAALAANPIVLITIAIAALVAGLIYAYQNFDIFRQVVDTALAVVTASFQWFWSVVQAVFGWIQDHWKLLLAIITGPIGAAVLIVMTYWDQIKGGAQAVLDWITTTFQTVGGWIVKPFQWAWEQIVGIKDSIVGAFQGAVDSIEGIWNTFARFWNNIQVEVPGVTMPGPIPNIPGFTFGLPDLPQFAKGGVVTRPTLGILGESGPEAVVPLGKLAGNVTINITTTGLGADAPAIQSAIVAALRGYTARNGPLSATITGA